MEKIKHSISMKIRSLMGIFFLFVLFSCGNQRKENIKTLLQTWSGKEILFPEKMVFARCSTHG